MTIKILTRETTMQLFDKEVFLAARDRFNANSLCPIVSYYCIGQAEGGCGLGL